MEIDKTAGSFHDLENIVTAATIITVRAWLSLVVDW
jgi:hypothetical protein